VALQDNVNYVRNLRLSVAVYPLIIIIRLFKSFAAQPKLAMVTKTLSSAIPDLLHFAVVFGSVFVTFTICGIVLFGREVGSFTTFNRALISCFRVMLGDIDWDELSAVGRTEAGIWLWMYIIVVVLLMLNMIIAIIMDHYEEIKTSSGHAETLLEEAQQAIHRWKGMRAGTYVPLNIVIDAIYDDMRRIQKAQKLAAGRMGSRKMSFGLNRQGTSGTTSGSSGTGLGEDTGMMTAQTTTTPPLSIDVHTRCIFPGDVIKFIGRYSNQKMTMHEDQAIEVLVGAVEDFYEMNKKGAELDEVVQLTQKVNRRVMKLVGAARWAHENRDTQPVKELEWFAKDVTNYLEDVRRERDANIARLEQLKSTKKHLETRLMSLGGGFVKSDSVSVSKRASIVRTAHRLTNLTPSTGH
jgi:hypothetical protein